MGTGNGFDQRPKRRGKGGDTFDGRTRRARRYRDLVAGFTADLGAHGERELALVHQAAAIVVQCEAEQGRILRGDAVDLEQLTRLTNVLARALAALGVKQAKGAKRVSVDEYLASRGLVP